jgi:hypothetical protein
MDISVNGGNRPNPSPNQTPVHGSAAKQPKSKRKALNSLSVLTIVLVVLIGLLIGLVTLALVFFNGNKDEAEYVKENQLQAVFLNGGQVYFGNIQDLNSERIRMTNIYYLRVNQQVQPGGDSKNAEQDISLVKLGCELHGPENQMVINREQVIFWENLKNDGQVAKAVKQYVEQNPDGQKCETEAPSDAKATPATPAQPEANN